MMHELLDAAAMRAADQYTIQNVGIPSMVLMERAALGVCRQIAAHFADSRRILCICGSGNNGGDGYAVARILNGRGFHADVMQAGTEAHMTGECRQQRSAFLNLGGREEAEPDMDSYDLLVDALFGIGLNRNVSGRYEALINRINECAVPVVAVDIPSGISADDGRVMGTAVRAAVTVTFSFYKPGQFLYPGKDCCGKVVLEDAGIVRSEEEHPSFFMLDGADLKTLLPGRKKRSNKGTFGKVALYAGSNGMAGASLLAAKACLRSGCGMVKVLTDEANRLILQTAVPEALYGSLSGSCGADVLEGACQWADVLGAGPGIGMSGEAWNNLKQLLRAFSGPVVLDADALNLIASECPGDSDKAAVFGRGNIIITPHPAEMARLCGCSTSDITDGILRAARSFAKKYGVVCVLKDAATVITDGDIVFINNTGSSALATAGSGDVLTGIICSLLAQGCGLMEAASAGVCLHGLAGEAAAVRYSDYGVTAADLPDAAASVIRGLQLT